MDVNKSHWLWKVVVQQFVEGVSKSTWELKSSKPVCPILEQPKSGWTNFMNKLVIAHIVADPEEDSE